MVVRTGRYSPNGKDAQWRHMVKGRDGNRCQVCGVGKMPRNIHAHHIESWSDNPHLRTELSNGVSLCKKCHMRFHDRYGRGGNTRAQYNEFVEQYKTGVVKKKAKKKIKVKVFKKKKFKVKNAKLT
jgi:5-methylcytosine-specific restriction endonuclease McrA